MRYLPVDRQKHGSRRGGFRRRWKIHAAQDDRGFDEACTGKHPNRRDGYRKKASVRTPDDLDRLADVYHKLPVWEYWLDILCSGDDKAKIALYKEQDILGVFQVKP